MPIILPLAYKLIPSSNSTAIFVHGFLGDNSQWNDIVEQLKHRYQILLVELPGHGKSPATESYQIKDVSYSIMHLLDKLGINKIHFIGHSMGGYVGCAFAAAYPEKVQSLTLINSCASADSLERLNQRNRSIALIHKFPKAFISMAIGNLFTKDEKETNPELLERMKSNAERITVDSIENAIIAMRDRPSQVANLKNCQLPTQYIYGKNDEIITKKTILKDLKSIPNSQATELNSGHMSILTHQNEIINSLLIE